MSSTGCFKCKRKINKFGDVYSWGQLSIHYKKICVGKPYCINCHEVTPSDIFCTFILNENAKNQTPIRFLARYNNNLDSIEYIRKVFNLLNITISKECTLSWYNCIPNESLI